MANSIDSNADCTRLVVDGWLELVISDSAVAIKVLSSACKIRDKWDSLLQAKLSRSGLRSAVLESASSKPSNHEIEKVADGLIQFLKHTEVIGLSRARYFWFRYILSCLTVFLVGIGMLVNIILFVGLSHK